MFPLDTLRAGERGEIAAVLGDAAWIGRLADLGVREGCAVCVLQPGSPCLLDVAGSRLCLRGTDASEIFVRPLSTKPV